MGLFVPHPRMGSLESNITGRPAAAWGTTVTAGGSANTLGTKVQLIASTGRDYNWVRVTIAETFASATVTDSLVNIYIGAAAAEVLLIPALLAGWSATIAQGASPVFYEFPLNIPGGSRLSADIQSAIVSKTAQVRIELFNRPHSDSWTGSKVEVRGSDLSFSKGTQVTPGTTSEGTLTSIGTTGRRWGYIQPVMIGNTDATATVGLLALDVGISSAVIPGLENFLFVASASEFFSNLEGGRFCDIPQSTALYARIQSHTTDAEAKSVILYGVT